MWIEWRQWVSAWLHRVADRIWIEDPVVVEPAPPMAGICVPVDFPALLRARFLVVQNESARPEASGEAKRHDVYARLIKDFPDVSKHVLANVIQIALEGRVK